ncbi:uncharacterized protein LOC115297661 [Suricata suricatta]|uniref:uncharacterized protein LOC115297661 n=1 Tax=Suricata suricatta TaxID=37032 RepID=UPI0011559382|nr:uncharacterized protein LOC115297661 [Suricata suricatta]
MNLGTGKWGWPRRPNVCEPPQLPTSPLRRPGHRTGSWAEVEKSQGAWARGRARAGGRSQGPPPPRPSGCPPRLPRARRSRRPEELEEERSEPSPGALGDRVPGGGGGGGSAPTDSFRHFEPENCGPQEVFLPQQARVATVCSNVRSTRVHFSPGTYSLGILQNFGFLIGKVINNPRFTVISRVECHRLKAAPYGSPSLAESLFGAQSEGTKQCSIALRITGQAGHGAGHSFTTLDLTAYEL